MLSECARATTAAESLFRSAAPNSLPRAVTVVAVDPASGTIVDDLAGPTWGRARFRGVPDRADAAAVIDMVAGSDLVVMVASVGQDVSAAAPIGEMCRLNRITTITLLCAASGTESRADQDDTARTLAQLRPHSDVLVAAASSDYVFDMLAALRA